MAPRDGHARFAEWLLSLAQRALESGDYIAAISSALRGVEEVIDAYAAEQDLHFHDDYPGEGWAKRQEWLSAHRPEFDAILRRFTETLVSVAAGKGQDMVGERVTEFDSLLRELGA